MDRKEAKEIVDWVMSEVFRRGFPYVTDGKLDLSRAYVGAISGTQNYGGQIAGEAVWNRHVSENADIRGTKIRVATISERGTVELADDLEAASGIALQADDSRLPPNDFASFGGYVVAVKGTEDGLEYIPTSGIGTTNFLGLTDTPASYVGEAYKSVRVNEEEDGLEFAIPLASGLVTSNLLLKEGSSTEFHVRNAADTAYRDIRVRDIYVEDALRGVAGAGFVLTSGSLVSQEAFTITTVGNLELHPNSYVNVKSPSATSGKVFNIEDSSGNRWFSFAPDTILDGSTLTPTQIIAIDSRTINSTAADPTTYTSFVAWHFRQVALTGTNPNQVFSIAATIRINGAPTASGNASITAGGALALWVDSGDSRFDGVIKGSAGEGFLLGSGTMAFQEATTISNTAGDIALSPAADLTLSPGSQVILDPVAQVQAILFQDGATIFYSLDTRTTTTTAAHTWSGADKTVASATFTNVLHSLWTGRTITLTGSTTPNSTLQVAYGFGEETFVSATDPITINKATTIRVTAPIESTNISLLTSSAIRILNTLGAPTNQVGIFIESLTAGVSANYALYMEGTPTIASASTLTISTLAGDINLSPATAIVNHSGNSGATFHKLVIENTTNSAIAAHAGIDIRVGGTTSTGDPQIRWTIPGGTSWYGGVDNSGSDAFCIGIGTNVGLTQVLRLTRSAANEHFAQISPGGTSNYDVAYAGNMLALTLLAYTMTIPGGTPGPVTVLDGAMKVGAVTFNGAFTWDKTAALIVAPPIEGATATLSHNAGIRILTATGSPTIQTGLYIETMTNGGTNYAVYMEGTPTITGAGTTTFSTASGDLILDPTASFNVTVTAADADAITWNDGTTDLYNLNTLTNAETTIVHRFDATNPTIASASGAYHRTMAILSKAVTLTGTTTVDAMDGLQLYLEAPTINDASVVTVSVASTLYVSTPVAAGSVTIAANYPINTESGAFLTSAGVWTDNPSTIAKKDLVVDIDGSEMHDAITAIRARRWVYKKALGDSGRTRFGIVAEELPEFLYPLGSPQHNVVQPSILAGFALAGLTYHETRLDEMSERIRRLEQQVVSLGGIP